tara:strand:+ start:111 stop:800 length:690 start_codon:yes stop_codon:yes gene_type:complete
MKNSTAILIPARGGSKGIKNKNLKNFNKKPLIFWTIKQAIQSKFSSDIYVTSDSNSILNFSKKIGVKTIKRPKSIAKDISSTEEAILHFLENPNINYENIILLQPTSPLRKIKDIDNAFDLFVQKKCNSLFSVSFFSDFTVWKALKNNIVPFSYNPNKRIIRQKDTKYFIENGSIYIFKSSIIKKHMNRIDVNSFAIYKMNKLQFFEIDDIEDFKICEHIFKSRLYLKL